MNIDMNQILYLFFCKFKDYGMKLCRTFGIVTINITENMLYSFYIQFSMNDQPLSCKCDVHVDVAVKKLTIVLSPKNKFDVYNLILPGNQDPSVIQKTYKLLQTELSKSSFNIIYSLTFSELESLYMEFIDGKD